jgi:ubiquitin carboxyl-terminal hydrolase 25
MVTEDIRSSREVLDELNEGGDPYYVAYVRDDTKDDLVEVPQRRKAAVTTGDEDVEMQTIDGIAPESVRSIEITGKSELASAEEPPPYEIL